MNRGLLGSYHKNNGPLPDTREMDEKDYTHSVDNRKHVHCEDLQSSLNTQTHHKELSLQPLLPLEPPKVMSSHASSEASASEPLTSCDEPPSCWTDDTFASIMALSSSQKETKESLDKQDSRGGGLSGPIKTEEWRSRKEAGIGNCWKSPTMAHWQVVEDKERCKGPRCSLMKWRRYLCSNQTITHKHFNSHSTEATWSLISWPWLANQANWPWATWNSIFTMSGTW